MIGLLTATIPQFATAGHGCVSQPVRWDEAAHARAVVGAPADSDNAVHWSLSIPALCNLEAGAQSTPGPHSKDGDPHHVRHPQAACNPVSGGHDPLQPCGPAAMCRQVRQRGVA